MEPSDHRRSNCGILHLVVTASLALTALGAATPQRRIAFLDKGDVWVLPFTSSRPQRQTHTREKVEDFRFSPHGEYLAYARRLRHAEERPICSIVIVNVSSGAVIKEILPEDGWIDIDKWIGTRLLYHASSGMEVSGFFEFDAVRGSGRELDLGSGSRGYDTDLSPDGSLLAYVDDAGVGPTFEERLHLVDTASGADAIHVRKRSVMAPAISSATEAVAFVEVLGEGANARDRVWIYRRADKSLTLASDAAVTAKSAGSGVKWSPDDRYLSVNFGSRVTVLHPGGTGAPHVFRGTDACWSDASTVVVESARGIETVDVGNGNRHVLIAKATRPQCM